MTNWAERDKRITAGQIKGNIVTNAVTLITRGIFKATEYHKACDYMIELHKHVEGLDVLAATRPEVVEIKVQQYIDEMNEATKTKDLTKLDTYLRDNVKGIKGLDKADYEKVKKHALELRKSINKE